MARTPHLITDPQNQARLINDNFEDAFKDDVELVYSGSATIFRQGLNFDAGKTSGGGAAIIDLPTTYTIPLLAMAVLVGGSDYIQMLPMGAVIPLGSGGDQLRFWSSRWDVFSATTYVKIENVRDLYWNNTPPSGEVVADGTVNVKYFLLRLEGLL